MNKLRLQLASLCGIAVLGCGTACFAQAAPVFDFNGDGVADRIEYLPAQELVRVLSGANNAVLQTFAAPTPGEGFASTAAVVPDLSGDWAPDLVVGAPLVNLDGQPAGRVYALSFSGNVLWNTYGPEGARVGYEIGAIADQNNDGVVDILAGRSTNGVAPTQQAALFSGKIGQLLVVRQGTLDTLKTYVANGGRLYVASDLDDSGAVDQADLFEFLALLDKESPSADMNGDGLLNAIDLVLFIEDYVNGAITIQALATPTSLVLGHSDAGIITDFGGSGCKECEATPASVPASGCQSVTLMWPIRRVVSST